MKKLLSLLCACLLFFLMPPARVNAHADTQQYAVCPTPDVWFYAAKNESSRLFLVPYTYYVKIVGRGDLYTAVEYLTDDAPYQQIEGYCKTADLLFVDFVPARPYLYREITLTYSRSQDSAPGGGTFDTMQRDCVYYGCLYEGRSLYYYVLSDGVFGYVQMDEELSFDLNTDYLTPASGEDPPQTEEGFPVAGIVVICLACAAAVGIAIFLFKGKKSSPDEEF